MITIAYMTNRKEPRIEWFFDSLRLQADATTWDDLRVVVVDYHAKDESRREYFKEIAGYPIVHVTPKPTVWQGPFRLASRNYFAASNARNTALCYAEDGYIAYVDDLSVLLPGWLDRVREGSKQGYAVLGTYRKVLRLKVEKGVVDSFDDHSTGHDSRLITASKMVPDENLPVSASGSWMFGCSVGIPVERLLAINGWDEDCDSMGFEDCVCGIMLERNGCSFVYDRQMRTLESEELHFVEQPFLRIIKPARRKRNDSLREDDSSWTMLNWVKYGTRTRAANYSDMVELRKTILAGGEFPPIGIPEHHWPDGQPIREM